MLELHLVQAFEERLCIQLVARLACIIGAESQAAHAGQLLSGNLGKLLTIELLPALFVPEFAEAPQQGLIKPFVFVKLDIAAKDSGLGEAIAQREPLLITDLMKRESNPLRAAAIEAGFRAALIVPLLSSDGPLGTLVLHRRQPLASSLYRS
jgi:GAF domain-containing protein